MRHGVDGAEFEGFLTAEWNEEGPSISPDGRWLAYQSDQSGENWIYVHSFPVITRQYPVSPEAGIDPRWHPDGRTLYYRSGSQYVAVDVTTEPTFRVSVPRLLFDRPGYGQWDIHPDGSRFVVVAPGEDSQVVASDPRRLVLITNWFEELRQRMGN